MRISQKLYYLEKTRKKYSESADLESTNFSSVNESLFSSVTLKNSIRDHFDPCQIKIFQLKPEISL